MSTSSTSPGPAASQFGPNEWLVEEMYQRFLDDPETVDPAWHEFFADYRPEAEPAATDDGAAPAADGPPTAPLRHRPGPPSPRPPLRRPRRQAEAPKEQPAPKPAEQRARPATPSAPSAEKPAAGAASQAAKPAAANADGTVTPLRGAASAVVKNMNASLTVPTATSVRAVPAKLLADNRIVINNQLKRTRGGKISFTHLIGYALVKALANFPEMNRHFAETDGKPTVVQPEHVNLGLAIDLHGKNGQRQLVVASIKGCEAHDLRPVLGGLRGHRPQGPRRQPDRRGLRRHHDQPHQPGHARHQPLGAAADAAARARSSASARWSTRPSSRARATSGSPTWASARSSR